MTTFVSLFAGAGGLDLGFVQAGFIPVWTNEADPLAAATYRRLISPLVPEHEIVVGDLDSQRWPGRGAADIVIGGPPCQGFSIAGDMKVNDPRNRLVWTFMDVVQRVRPAAFVMENVKGLATNIRWAPLRQDLIARGKQLGYRTEIFLLNASHFGVPQARERMFLIGISESNLPQPRRTSMRHAPTLRSALATLPHIGTDGNNSLCTARVTPARNPVLRASPFAGMLFNGHGRPINIDAPAPTVHATMGGNRTPIIDQLQLDQGAPHWVIQYHRRLMRGGSPLNRVPRRLRRMTVEEAAAAQAFPRGVDWVGSQAAQYRQIGNAVPPKLAKQIAKAIARALA